MCLISKMMCYRHLLIATLFTLQVALVSSSIYEEPADLSRFRPQVEGMRSAMEYLAGRNGMVAEDEAALDAIVARKSGRNLVIPKTKKRISPSCRVGQGQAGVQPVVSQQPSRSTQPAVKGILRDPNQARAKKHVRFDEERLVSGTMLCPKWIKHCDDKS